jgi:hypothetical protein
MTAWFAWSLLKLTLASLFVRPSTPIQSILKISNAQNGKPSLTASPNTSNGNVARHNNRRALRAARLPV